jgi:hypothetical protein
MRHEIGATSVDPRSRNDCTVRAVANAWGMPYDEAAQVCKKHGRKRINSGMKGTAVMEMLTNLGARRMPLHGSKVWITLNVLDSTRTYLVLIPGHIFTVRNGVVLDCGDIIRWTRRFNRKPVLGLWELPQASPVPEQLNLFS